MTILLTGGTGKIGVPTARRIASKSGHTILLASLRGAKPEALSGPDHTQVYSVKFDWFHKTSCTNPFDYVASHNLSGIDRIYLVGPVTWNVAMMNDFIDFARERGVRKPLLLTASQAEIGDPSVGQVHAYLKKLGEVQVVEWMVIRPNWFIGTSSY